MKEATVVLLSIIVGLDIGAATGCVSRGLLRDDVGNLLVFQLALALVVGVVMSLLVGIALIRDVK